ncbi:tRNA (guanosine(46)-N7)-methyltransferase TrmB, partial [Gammaproteobacteria bacterium]|nr:tRNA (guanosine(46)-N7)-methyltransferase TrmB [Gammaproteobacteria bacterium]
MSQQIRLKSYVKRSGRLTNSQKKILEKKEYNINFFNSNKILSCQELFNNYNPCILDIGFGDGKLLTDIAK